MKWFMRLFTSEDRRAHEKTMEELRDLHAYMRVANKRLREEHDNINTRIDTLIEEFRRESNDD
jgi:hypothetical protein